MKKYKDLGIYDFSDYAEEITGDALFKINGGGKVENSHEGVAGAKPGDTITRKNGDVIVLKQADIDYANAQLENNGNDGTGNTNGNSGTGNNSNSESNNTSNSSSTNNSSSGANKTGTSNTSTSESTPEVSEEIKQNSDAYANYMSMQGRAKDEGEPDRYKGYNVLGPKKEIALEILDHVEELKTIKQVSVGVRGALVIGGELSLGIVINPNNYWDSGVFGTIGVGTGIDVGISLPFSKPINSIIENTLGITSSIVDFTAPKSTKDLEGCSNTAYASALVGISHDLDTNKIKGIELLTVGGGVYHEKTTVYTVGSLAEKVYNTVAIVGNIAYNLLGIDRTINYIELDGK